MYVLSRSGMKFVNIDSMDALRVEINVNGKYYIEGKKDKEFCEIGYYKSEFEAKKDLRKIMNTYRGGGNIVDLTTESDGKWTLASDGDGIVCSVCGADFCTIVHETERFHYCPNCGAKMSGEGLKC